MDLAEYGLQLGDVKFLRQKEDEGNLVSSLSAVISATGTAISYVVPDGKTFYFLKASMIPQTETDASGSCLADVELDGTDIDHLGYVTRFHTIASASGQARSMSSTINKSETTVTMKKLVGNGIKAVTVNVTAISAVTVRFALLGFLEDS